MMRILPLLFLFQYEIIDSRKRLWIINVGYKCSIYYSNLSIIVNFALRLSSCSYENNFLLGDFNDKRSIDERYILAQQFFEKI